MTGCPHVDLASPETYREGVPRSILEALDEVEGLEFSITTKSPLVLRDLDLLKELAGRTRLRVSFSITTDREDVRRRYEPRCEPIPERLAALSALRDASRPASWESEPPPQPMSTFSVKSGHVSGSTQRSAGPKFHASAAAPSPAQAPPRVEA